MTDKFTTLFGSMEMALANMDKDLASVLDALPPPKKLPLPGATWLLFVLIRYVVRQRWARDLIKEKLPEACPPSAKLCRQDQPVCLSVPGMPDWRLTVNAWNQWAYLHCDRPPEIRAR